MAGSVVPIRDDWEAWPTSPAEPEPVPPAAAPAAAAPMPAINIYLGDQLAEARQHVPTYGPASYQQPALPAGRREPASLPVLQQPGGELAIQLKPPAPAKPDRDFVSLAPPKDADGGDLAYWVLTVLPRAAAKGFMWVSFTPARLLLTVAGGVLVFLLVHAQHR